MKTIMVLDANNYTDDMPVFEKYAVRGIIVRNGMIAMQKSGFGYFKILGGGVDSGENYEDALVREVQEESGLVVKKDTIRLIGEVVEMREDLYEKGKKFVCHSIYYFCDVESYMKENNMTASEIRDGYHLSWATPEHILSENARLSDNPWVDRDTRVLQMLVNGELKGFSL